MGNEMKSSLLLLFVFAIGGSSCLAQSESNSTQPQDPDVAVAEKPHTEKVEEKKVDVEKVTDTKNLADDPKALKRFQFQLRKRIGKDQKTRTAFIRYRQRNKTIDPEKIKALYKKASDVDGDNLKWAQSHIDEYGWPAISTIGSRRADEFFTIVLHADRDIEFQRKCLGLMSKMPAGEWSPKNHKTLQYRVKVLDGKYEHLPLPTTPLPSKRRSKSK